MPTAEIHDLPDLRDRSRVFRDRAHAGEALAAMLEGLRGTDAIVLAIPAGGVPVAAEIAGRLGLPLDLAIVSKALLPWTTEAGFGAIAFDGSAWIDEEAVRAFGLSDADVERSVAAAREKVARRLVRLRGGRPMPTLADRTAILVDDGIAAGSTMRAAIAALREVGAKRIVVAVPTALDRSARAIASLADEIFVANLRHGISFAVADAYEDWYDVSEDEVAALLGDA
jgi:predicted phosphoribosyltransferase